MPTIKISYCSADSVPRTSLLCPAERVRVVLVGRAVRGEIPAPGGISWSRGKFLLPRGDSFPSGRFLLGLAAMLPLLGEIPPSKGLETWARPNWFWWAALTRLEMKEFKDRLL